MTKIIKNQSGITRTILNKVVPNGGQIDVQSIYFNELPNNQEIISLIQSGDYIVNDGIEDLTIEAAIAHVNAGTRIVESHVELLPGVGATSPEVVQVNAATSGFKMEIGDKVFSNDKYESLVGNNIKFNIYAIIDNSDADKWVSFDVSLKSLSNSGGGDGTSVDQTYSFGPFEVPTTPNEVFVMSGEIPSGIIDSSNSTIFFGGERTDVTNLGKQNPTNDPIVLFISKSYRKSVG